MLKKIASWAGIASLLAGCVSTQRPVETVYDWRTLSGQPGGLGNMDGQGEMARFCQPCGVAFDAAGNVYVSDYYNYAIRKVSPDGAVTTLAGCIGEAGSNDGTGSAARFDRPLGLAVDGAGTVYVADSGSHLIRKVTAEGAVTTLAGSAGNAGYADGTGREARFRSPSDVAVDAAGNVYVADVYNHAIRKISPAGAVTTLAGKVELASGQPVGGAADGKGSAARFHCPRGVAVDGSGVVYVADTENATLRKVMPDGTVKTLVGSAGNAGYVNGTNGVARFSNPQGLALDAQGNIYVADTGNLVVRKVTVAGSVSTLTNGMVRFTSPRAVAADRAGNLAVADNDSQTITRIAAKGGFALLAGSPSRHGSADGACDAARFSRPCGIVADGQGRLTVTDNFNHTLRTVTPDGVVTTLAGRALSSGTADGTNGAARFFWPSGAARDGAGNVYVADAGNHTVRKVAADGTVSTVAGGAGVSGWTDGRCGTARFAWPSDVACDASGVLYVADRGNHVIRKITKTGDVTTLAGGAGKPGRADGVGGAARFSNPSGVAVDAVGNVYVADTGNHTVRKVIPNGEVTTLAGCAGIRGGADGVGVLARFNGPADVEADAAGNVYVADRDNHMVRRVTPSGRVTTLGGMPNAMSAADGLGTAARFAQPSGVTLDGAGVLYVADACNNRIAVGRPLEVEQRVRSRAGGARTAEVRQAGKPDAGAAAVTYVWEVFAGQPGTTGIDDGIGREARLAGPQGLAIDDAGVLYVADGRGNTIRKISSEGRVTTLRGAPGTFAAPIGIAVDRASSCYVTDSSNRLWKVSASGTTVKVTSVAARCTCMPGVAIDRTANLYFADFSACTIRKVTPAGEATVFAGRSGQEGSVDGRGSSACFNRPLALAADAAGNLMVAAGNRLRRVSPAGEVTTLAEGAPFGHLDGVACDSYGNAYVADRERHVIWRVTPRGAFVRLAGSELAMGGSGWLVTGLAVDHAGRVYVADSVRNCILRGTPQ